jgi:hypothetical protein
MTPLMGQLVSHQLVAKFLDLPHVWRVRHIRRDDRSSSQFVQVTLDALGEVELVERHGAPMVGGPMMVVVRDIALPVRSMHENERARLDGPAGRGCLSTVDAY